VTDIPFDDAAARALLDVGAPLVAAP
jgi:hypothetical protein